MLVNEPVGMVGREVFPPRIAVGIHLDHPQRRAGLQSGTSDQPLSGLPPDVRSPPLDRDDFHLTFSGQPSKGPGYADHGGAPYLYDGCHCPATFSSL